MSELWENPGRLDSFYINQIGRGSRAYVADNGRVNIKITESASDLSSVLADALAKPSQQRPGTQSTSYGRAPNQATFSSSSLPLNIVIQVVGSRGDVQPFIALGKTLKSHYGHRVRLATHPTFQSFVEQNGLEFFSIGGDPAELMAFMVKNPGLMPGEEALREGQIGQRRKAMMEIMQRCWRSCFEPGDGNEASSGTASTHDFVADAIIANPPSFAHIHCAERLGLPLHMMFTMPWSPTQVFPHPLSNIQSTEADIGFTNFMTYTIVELLTWQGLGDLVNSFREITLGLQPLTTLSGPGALTRLKIPYTYCWSPALVPKPQDWSENIDVSGFYFLNQSSSYDPPSDLSEFLALGPPPVYIGFGSIVVDDPDRLTTLILDAVQRTGMRALVSKGWGGLGSQSLSIPPSVFMLGNVPHDWLFHKVSCVVHHGGAGTTAAGITAGKPTIIVPFFGDQPFWGSMIYRAGAGPAPIPFKDLTASKLSDAIEMATQPTVIAKAQDMARQISAEVGTKNGAESFSRYLDSNHLRCSLTPSHKAVWQLIDSNCKLSPLAASVLIHNKEISVDQLALFRAREYQTVQGPTDPFTGGASALIGTIGSLMGGISDIPPDFFGRLKRSIKRCDPQLPDESITDLDSKEHTLPLNFQTSVDAGRGAIRAISAGLRSPMDFTLALAKGFHNAPRLYGDTTVRKQPEIKGVTSGIKAATIGLGQGFFDGISGLFTHPIAGARTAGFDGFAKGMGKAIGGVVLKPAAGIWGVPGYLSDGFWQEMKKRISTRSDAEILAGRVRQGERALRNSSLEEQQAILQHWKDLKSSGILLVAAAPQSSLGFKAGSGAAEASTSTNPVIAASMTLDDDALISQAVEAYLRRQSSTSGPGLPGLDDDTASSIVSTSTQHTDETLVSRSHLASRAHQEVGNRRSSEDDPDVESDDDQNMKEALLRSRAEN